MKKRTLAAVALWMLLGIVGVGSARAQDDHGNTRETASLWDYWYESETSPSGELEREGDIDYFRFTVTGPGASILTLKRSTPSDHRTGYRVRVEDQNGRDVSPAGFSDNSPGGPWRTHYTRRFYVAYLVMPGTYYVKVIQGADPELVRRGAQFEPTGSYSVSLEVYSVKPDDHSDFPFAEYATRVRLNSSVRGTVQTVNRSYHVYHVNGGLDDFDVDFFRIDVDRPGTLTVYTTGELYTLGSLRNSSDQIIYYGRGGGDGHNFQIVATVPYPLTRITIASQSPGHITWMFTLELTMQAPTRCTWSLLLMATRPTRRVCGERFGQRC